jgi:hypothetical protein
VRLDPSSAAYFALIAICLVLVGALLTVGVIGVAERAAVLVAIGSVLLTIAWRSRHPGGPPPE